MIRSNTCDSGKTPRGRHYASFRSLFLAIILVVSTTFVLRRVLWLPYIADDWTFIHWFQFNTTRAAIAHAFDPTQLFFRPFTWLYTLTIFKLFGSYSSAFHIPALAVHCCNSLIVVYIMRRILGSERMAWVTGFLYAFAVNIHLDPQMWMSGCNDIFGALFIFSALALLIAGKDSLSAICYLCAILFKEASVAMIVVMFGYVAYENLTTRVSLSTLRVLFHRLWRHCAVAAAILAIKSMSSYHPLSLPADHPYKMKLFGTHLLSNGVSYVVWFIQSVVPFDLSHPRRMLRFLMSELSHPTFVIVVVAALAFLVAALLVGWKGSRGLCTRDRDRVALLSGWAVFGIAPVYFMPNHVYPYYLTYSLPACIGLVLLAARVLAGGMPMKQWTATAIVIACVVLRFAIASNYIDKSLAEKNAMLVRAMQVRAIHAYLAEHYSFARSYTDFVLRGQDWPASLGGERAIQVWYRDHSIGVFDSRYLRGDSKGVYVVAHPTDTPYPCTKIRDHKHYLNPKATACLGVSADYRVVEWDCGLDLRRNTGVTY